VIPVDGKKECLPKEWAMAVGYWHQCIPNANHTKAAKGRWQITHMDSNRQM
jgi:hypothetical protein